jgi:ribonuclease BN (tRNA processing enzyme)/ActR/RegA family two-component response regulator
MTHKPVSILVADPEKKIHTLFDELATHHPYLKIYHATTSDKAIEVFTTHPIDIAFLDLYLSPIHGLEILKKLKILLPEADVVITSYEPMIQNFRACLTHGALDFIAKPLTQKLILSVLDGRHLKPYTPHLFSLPHSSSHPFVLKEHSKDTYIKFWGTRGSHSVSGTQFVRFGGNTSCLEIKHGDHLVIIDGGTGISSLGQELVEQKTHTDIELLVGHTHLDHMAGLPGFMPLHEKSFCVTLRAPINFYKNTKELLSDMLTHAFFPVDLEEIKASLKFIELTTLTPFQVGPIKIETHYTYHPGTTLGFKIEFDGLVIGYVTDNETLMGYTGDPKLITPDHPLLVPHLSFIEFFKNADIMIHEAQYTPQNYAHKVGWGHSSIYNAAVMIKYIDPKVWIVTHHDPEASDDILHKQYETLSEVCEYLGLKCGVRMAFDGLKINF